MDSRRDLGGPVDELEVGLRPRRAEAHRVGRRAIVVALLRRQRRILAIESARQIGAIDAKSFLGRVDLHFRIDAQEVRHAAHVMPCRCDMTTKSSLARSTPFALAFRARISGLLPVSNRMRLPPYSISAAYPQSFCMAAALPKGS